MISINVKLIINIINWLNRLFLPQWFPLPENSNFSFSFSQTLSAQCLIPLGGKHGKEKAQEKKLFSLHWYSYYVQNCIKTRVGVLLLFAHGCHVVLSAFSHIITQLCRPALFLFSVHPQFSELIIQRYKIHDPAMQKNKIKSICMTVWSWTTLDGRVKGDKSSLTLK